MWLNSQGINDCKGFEFICFMHEKLAFFIQGKFHTFYWNIKQHGQAGLTREDLWFTVCLLRSNAVTRVQGGLSQVTKQVVDLFSSLNNGLVVTVNGER